MRFIMVNVTCVVTLPQLYPQVYSNQACLPLEFHWQGSEHSKHLHPNPVLNYNPVWSFQQEIYKLSSLPWGKMFLKSRDMSSGFTFTQSVSLAYLTFPKLQFPHLSNNGDNSTELFWGLCGTIHGKYLVRYQKISTSLRIWFFAFFFLIFRINEI